ncbi:MlaD family protein [Mycobacterium avium]
MFNPFGGKGPGMISLVIETPYVGEGVANGTAVVLHGVKVGQVTRVASLPGGGVRLNADLRSGPVTGLTDTMTVDFRPINYFGVTGINLIAGSDGLPLHDGMRINTIPKGNFTLQALLYRLGEVSAGALTPQLIKVIERGTRYLDALDPLLETMLIAANAVAGVQSISTAQLLSNTTELSAPIPGFVGSLTSAGQYYINSNSHLAQFGMRDFTDAVHQIRSVGLATTALHVFGDVGKLESSHVGDLLPLVDSIKSLVDVVPPLIRPEGIAQTLVELRSRFEKMYAGIPGQPALNVRIALDSLPGVAGPLGIAVGR